MHTPHFLELGIVALTCMGCHKNYKETKHGNTGQVTVCGITHQQVFVDLTANIAGNCHRNSHHICLQTCLSLLPSLYSDSDNQ